MGTPRRGLTGVSHVMASILHLGLEPGTLPVFEGPLAAWQDRAGWVRKEGGRCVVPMYDIRLSYLKSWLRYRVRKSLASQFIFVFREPGPDHIFAGLFEPIPILEGKDLLALPPVGALPTSV